MSKRDHLLLISPQNRSAGNRHCAKLITLNKTDSAAALQNTRTTVSACIAARAAAIAPQTSYAGKAPATGPFPAGSRASPHRPHPQQARRPISPPTPSCAARNPPDQVLPAHPTRALRHPASAQFHQTESPTPPHPPLRPPPSATSRQPPANGPHSAANISATPPAKTALPRRAKISLRAPCLPPPRPLPSPHPAPRPRSTLSFSAVARPPRAANAPNSQTRDQSP